MPYLVLVKLLNLISLEVHSTYRTHFVMNIFAYSRRTPQVGDRSILMELWKLLMKESSIFMLHHEIQGFVQGWETKGQIAFTQPRNHDIITWLTQSTEEPTAEDQWCMTEKLGVFRFSYHVAFRQVSQKGSNKFPSVVTSHDPFTQFKLVIILISYFSKHRN